MNYPLRTAVMEFAHNDCSAYNLRDFLIGQQMNYPWPFYYSLMNLLGSHDVPRLKTVLACPYNLRSMSREDQLAVRFEQAALERAEKLEKMCAALQFAIPGVPSIYYGDEQGMEGVGDPFNRAPFREGDSKLHDYYINLSALRNSDPVFAEGEVSYDAPSADILTIVRYYAGDHGATNSVYLTVINRGEEADYFADLSYAGLGMYAGKIAAESAETIRIR
jgi:4-alpha-glucanotransferase